MPIEGQDSKHSGRNSDRQLDSEYTHNLVDMFLELQEQPKKDDGGGSSAKQNTAETIETLNMTPIQSVILGGVEPAPENTAKAVDPATVLASAKAIRAATYRDAWVYSGTDEETIFKVLSSMTEDERLSLRTVYQDKYKISLVSELKRELSGSQLDKSLNLLNKKDGIADNAGFVHELVTELNQTVVGRSRSAIGRTLREKLSSMSSKEVETMDRDYESRYGISAKDALLKQGRLDTETKEAFRVYFKGADKTTDVDALNLARTALKSHDLTMFREAMVLASADARKQFSKEIDGNRGLRDAFVYDYWQLAVDVPIGIVEGAWSLADRPQSVQNFMYATDYLKYGKLSAITQVKDASGIVDDNESSIESALLNMSDEERELFRNGKSLAQFGLKTDDSVDSKRAGAYYDDLVSAMEGAGNPSEVRRWIDMAANKGGTMIGDLVKHRGMLYNAGAGKVISDIENMSKSDWNALKKNPNEFSRDMREMLKTLISQKDVERAMDTVSEKIRAATYEDSLKAGQRTLEKRLKDGSVWDKNGADVVNALLNMSEEEQRQYRTNPLAQANLDELVYKAIDHDYHYQKAAEHILNEVKQGKAPTNDIIVKLYKYASMFNPDDGEVLREVEKAFENDPQLLSRISEPETVADRTLAREFRDSLARAIGPIDFIRYGEALLKKGSLTVHHRAHISRGWIYNEHESMIKSALSSNETDKKLLLSKNPHDLHAAGVQNSVFGQMTNDQAQFVRTMLKQGEFRPADTIRSFVVGGGAKSSEVIGVLAKLPVAEQAKLRDEYSQKYGANMVADLNYWLKPDEQAMLTGLIKTDGRTSAEVYNEELDQYSKSRDGLGQWFVDNEWDVTGFQAEEAVGQYTRALAQSAQTGKELEAARQLEITQQIAQSLTSFRNSKLAAGEAVANGTIAGAAIVAAPFTAGTSLTVLAKIAIAGAAGAAIKVGTKAALSGADYDFSAKRLTVDGGTGFIAGAASVLGPTELANVLGVGGKVGTQAASIATSSLAQVGKQSGALLIKEGSEEVVSTAFVGLVRQAMVNGSERVSEQALSSLAQQIATKGNEAVVELALKQSLNAAITEATANAFASYSVQIGLPTANGAISGGFSGAVTGAAEWDSRLPAGKNLESIAISAGVNGTVNAASAFTIGTMTRPYTYRSASVKSRADANTHSVKETIEAALLNKTTAGSVPASIESKLLSQ